MEEWMQMDFKGILGDTMMWIEYIWLRIIQQWTLGYVVINLWVI
jgi:hypothetical protein